MSRLTPASFSFPHWALSSISITRKLAALTDGALAAGGQAVGGLFDFQRRFGRWLHEELPGSQLFVPDGYPPGIWHDWFVDAVLEESLEAIAAACLLALVLTLGRERLTVRSEGLPDRHG